MTIHAARSAASRLLGAGLLIVVVLLAGCGADFDEDQATQDTDQAADDGAVDQDAGGVGDGVGVGDGGVRVRQGAVVHLAGGVQVGLYSLLGDVAAQLSVVTPDASEDIELEVGDRRTVGAHTVELLRIGGGGVNVEVVDGAGVALGEG